MRVRTTNLFLIPSPHSFERLLLGKFCVLSVSLILGFVRKRDRRNGAGDWKAGRNGETAPTSFHTLTRDLYREILDDIAFTFLSHHYKAPENVGREQRQALAASVARHANGISWSVSPGGGGGGGGGFISRCCYANSVYAPGKMKRATTNTVRLPPFCVYRIRCI